MHEPMIGQIHHFFLSKIELIPFIIANQQHKSMRTIRIDRCEPRYAGTEFTNRVASALNIPQNLELLHTATRVLGHVPYSHT